MRSQFRIWTDRGGKERSLLRIVFPASIDLKKPSHLRIFSNQATRAKTRKTNLIFCGGALGGSVRPESRQWVSRANLAFGAFDGATVIFRVVPTLFDCLAGGAFPPGPIGGMNYGLCPTVRKRSPSPKCATWACAASGRSIAARFVAMGHPALATTRPLIVPARRVEPSPVSSPPYQSPR